MTKLITEDFRKTVSDVMMNYLWEPNTIETRRRMTEELQHYVFKPGEKVVDRSTPELIERGQYLLMVQMADGKEITFADYEDLTITKELVKDVLNEVESVRNVYPANIEGSNEFNESLNSL